MDAQGEMDRPVMASSRVRRTWWIMVVVFAATMISYADRQVLALLKPVLDARFHWTSHDYGLMTTGFQIAIAVALLGAGWFMDRAGLRTGFAVGLGGWSAAAVAHAAARSVPQFLAARVMLGVFEAVVTPASMKAVATHVPASKRSLVIGIGNAGPNLAAMLTPLAVTALYLRLGWEGTVVVLGGAGFVCLAVWLALPQGEPREAVAYDVMAAGRAGPAAILSDRSAWALAAAKLLTDQAWWFMLFWLPDVLHRRFALDMAHLGLPVATVYLMAAGGSLAGGVLPTVLSGRGMPPRATRSLCLGLFALTVLPVAFIPVVHGLWPTILVAGLALASHQGFATNIFGLATELFPASRVGSAIGFAAFAGNIGGAASLYVAGQLGSLQPMFIACAAGYPLAWMAIRILAR